MALLFGILLIGAVFRHGIIGASTGLFKIIGILFISAIAIHLINFIITGGVFVFGATVDSVNDIGVAIDFKNLFVIKG